MNDTFLSRVFLVSSLSLLSACGAYDADLRVFSVPLEAPVASQDFPAPVEMQFKSNRVFLWPRKVEASQIALVMRMGQEVDRADNERFDAEYHEEALRNRLGEVITIPERLTGEYQPRRNTISRQLDLFRRQGKAEKVAEFERKLADIDQEIADLQARYEDAKSRLDPNNEAPVELDFIRKRFDIAARIGDVALKNIMSVVEMDDDGPDTVFMNTKEDGSLSVMIQGWAPGSVGSIPGRNRLKRNFSTDDGSITGATFSPLNGKVEFSVTVYGNELKTDIQARYDIKIARTEFAKSADPTDGRVFYVGEVWRTSPIGEFCPPDEFRETGCRRKGVLKMVDRASRN